MTLRGSVETIALVDLLQVIQGNGHAGTLKVTSGERTSKLYFYKGQIFLPMSGAGGALKIGALLVKARKISGHNLVRALALQAAGGSGEKLGEVLIREGLVKAEDLDALVRRQFEEEIYDLLFREDAYFEWKRDVLPAGLTDAKGNIRAKDFDTRSILMEASRRQDEWRRIRERIPSQKAVYRLAQPGEPSIKDGEDPAGTGADLDEPPDEAVSAIALETLRKAGADVEENPFDGSRNVEDVVALTNLSAFESLGVIARLRDENIVRPIAASEIEARALRALEEDRAGTAYKLYAWTNEVEQLWPIASELDKELLKPHALSQAAHPAFAGRTGGLRALTILSRLLRRGAPFHFHAREEDVEIDVYLTAKILRMHLKGSKRPHSAVRALRSRGALSEEGLRAAREAALRTGRDIDRVLVDDGFVPREVWLLAVKDKIVSGLFSIFEWHEAFVEFGANAQVPPANQDGQALVVEVPLSDPLRDDLRKDLLRWKSIVQAIPSTNVVFVCSKPTAEGKKKRTYDLLDGRRTVADLLSMSKVAPLELVRFLLEALLDQRIRRLTDKEHEVRLEKALAASRFDDAIAYAKSAIAFGFSKERFRARLVEIRERTKGMPSTEFRSTVQGELGQVSLAEVLQLLHQGKRNGTLRIVDQEGTAEKRLYLDGGEIFILDIQEPDPDDDLLDLLGGDSSQGEALGSNKLKGRGRLAEDAVEKAEIDRIKNGLFEAFLWEGARFEFLQNVLPPELRSDAPNVTKLALKTELLLFEAMQRLAEWDELRKLLRSARAVFEFASSEAKMGAVHGDHPTLAYLFDGRHSLADIVRSSNEDRFTVYRFARTLIEKKSLVFVRMKEMTAKRITRDQASSGRLQIVPPDGERAGGRIGLASAPERGFPGLPAAAIEDDSTGEDRILSGTQRFPAPSRGSSRPGFLGSTSSSGSIPTDSVSIDSDSVSDTYRGSSSDTQIPIVRPPSGRAPATSGRSTPSRPPTPSPPRAVAPPTPPRPQPAASHGKPPSTPPHPQPAASPSKPSSRPAFSAVKPPGEGARPPSSGPTSRPSFLSDNSPTPRTPVKQPVTPAPGQLARTKSGRNPKESGEDSKGNHRKAAKGSERHKPASSSTRRKPPGHESRH